MTINPHVRFKIPVILGHLGCQVTYLESYNVLLMCHMCKLIN